MWGGKFPTIKASVLCAKFQSNNDHLLSCPIGSAARDCRLGLTNCPCVIATIIRVLNYLFVHIAVRLVCVKFCSKPAEQSFLVSLALLLFYMRCVCVYVKACSVRTKSNEQHQQDNVVTSSISLHLCLIWTSSAEAFFFFSPTEAGWADLQQMHRLENHQKQRRGFWFGALFHLLLRCTEERKKPEEIKPPAAPTVYRVTVRLDKRICGSQHSSGSS